MRDVAWTMITLTVAYVLLVPFALWVGLAHWPAERCGACWRVRPAATRFRSP
jgi:hypothetical protein